MVQWSRISLHSSLDKKLLGAAAVVLIMCVCCVGAGQWHCGTAASTLMRVCNSCYATLDKRSSNSKSSYTPARPFLHKRNAVHFLRSAKREIHIKPSIDDTGLVSLEKRRSGHVGFIFECCDQYCSAFEMILYCCEERQLEWARTNRPDFLQA